MPFVKEAMEGSQGIVRFFSTAMQWGELEQMAVLPDDLGEEFGGDEDRLQRGLVRSRIAPLVSYLTEVPDHFFSALTLIILPRQLDRPAREASGADDEEDWDFWFERGERRGPGRSRFGTIHISAGAQLFPADGQHRLRAALDAIRIDPALAREEVPVVLVPYQNRDQVGQLFSDLNLNAKPVNKSVGYSLESRNPVVLVAKQMMNAVPLFRGRVHRASNSLPKSSANVITMSGLVEGTRTLLGPCVEGRDTSSRAAANSKSASALDGWIVDHEDVAASEARAMWTAVIEPFLPLWSGVLDGEHGAAGRLRDLYVFPHGLGWSALTQAAAELRRNHARDWERPFHSAVNRIDWKRTNPEWEGRATVSGSVTNTSQNVRATADFVRQAAIASDSDR